MQALVVTSGIKRPFAPIDQSVIRALKQLDINVTPVLPGDEMNARLDTSIVQQQPDFILVLMAWRLTKRNWVLLKRQSAIPRIAWFTDDPYYMDWSQSVGKHFDIVFTNESRSVPIYRRNGCRHVHHLPLGVDTADFYPRQTVPERYRSDVLVLGTAFHNRRTFMRHLLPHLHRSKVRLVGPGWEKIRQKRDDHVAIYPKWVPIKDVHAYYNGAKIVLNLHRSPRDEYLRLNRGNVAADTPNNRTFEVAACSTLQLVESRADLDALYPPPADVPAFRTPQQCLKLLGYYLPRKKQRQHSAAIIYRHTLRTHQYVHRLQTLLKHIHPEPIC